MINADVAVLEISHELDKRLIELTKLNKKWFDKLGDYLKNECTTANCIAAMQVNNFDEKGKCRHLAIFRREADYSILIVLTVGEENCDDNTRIRALLKDVPRGMTWEAIRDKPALSQCWRNLRTEIENFMVSIALFLVKTMIDD